MISIGALLGALGVGAGAFGAHALKTELSLDDLQAYETGVRYQIYHALALLLCAGLPLNARRRSMAAHAFTWGTLLFSGSIYLLVLSDLRWLFGPITPFGGVLLILGWLALLSAGLSRSGSTAVR